MDRSPIERAVCEWCLVFGSLAAQCHRLWSRECRNGCVILERAQRNRAMARLAYDEGFASLGCRRLGCCRRSTQSSGFARCCSTDPGRAASRVSRAWHFSIENRCYKSIQMTTIQGQQSDFRCIRLSLTSTSRNTSRMSGFFRVCRDLVLPRTVRFKALTRSFTASAWCFESRAKMGANSDVGCSRPFKREKKMCQ
jgi:hypothetical protein